MASANSASTASGPALKVEVSSFDVGAEVLLAKMPFSTPTRAGAWVTFGK